MRGYGTDIQCHPPVSPFVGERNPSSHHRQGEHLYLSGEKELPKGNEWRPRRAKARRRVHLHKSKSNPSSLNYLQLRKRGVKLSPHGDVDRDRVPNIADCRPLDPNKHAVKLTSEAVSGGQREGWVVRSYDPRNYEEHGTGVEHEKTFRHLEDVRAYIREEESGSLSSSAEASNAPRVYVQELWRMKDGRLRRRQVDIGKFS